MRRVPDRGGAPRVHGHGVLVQHCQLACNGGAFLTQHTVVKALRQILHNYQLQAIHDPKVEGGQERLRVPVRDAAGCVTLHGR